MASPADNGHHFAVQPVEEDALYEVLDPGFDETLGSLKTSNPKGNRWQRRYLHVSPKKSKFKKTVEMILCMHGWETPARTQPMTLLVFSVKLNCHSPKFRFQSVRMWLAFDEDDKADPPNTAELARPTVVGYAPFVRDEEWNASEESIAKTTSYGGELGASYVVSATVNTGRETERSHTRKHFDRGSADPMVDDEQRLYGVNWYTEQNKLQDYGVKPHFHLAVLLKRSHTKSDNKPIPFRGVFDMQIEAGFSHDFQEGARRLFRLGKPEDEAVYFDPGREDMVAGLQGQGEAISKRVNKERMGDLVQGDHLSSLLVAQGAEAGSKGTALEGLEPMEPRLA